MGKETKIGLGVIAVLLVVFAVVLGLRLTGSSDETIAAADTEESAVETQENDAAKAEAAPAPKLKPLVPPATNNKTASSNTKSSLKLTIPTAPVPEPDTKTNGQSQWKMVGGGPRQSPPPAPIPSSASSRYASGGLVLDPPSTQQPNQFGSDRYARRQPAGSSQTSRYQSPYGQSKYQNVSSGDTSTYGHGNNESYYGKQRNYVPRQGPPAQPTYAQQLAATPPRTAPSPITPREPAVAQHANGKYEVQPNDNYWSISERLYGSGAYFKALAEHNRREHPSADKLRVGDQIYVPSLDKLVDSFPDLCPSPRRQKTLAKRSNVIPVSAQYGGGKTYTVAEGDTLYDIARYELGDASRWPEILNINRDTLQGDFDYLVPGMKLTLPGSPASKQTHNPAQMRTPRGGSGILTQRPSQQQPASRNNLRRY